MSQETFIYDHSANSVLSVFILIKRVDVTKGCLCSLPRGVGRSYLQLKKKIKTKKYLQLEKLQLEKIKSKKRTMYNSKSKN